VAVINQEIDSLNGSITALRKRVETLDSEIAACETQIEQIETETATKEAIIKTKQEELMTRLRQQYMAGPVSNLQLLLESPDIASLLTVSEYIRLQAERDEAVRQQLTAEMQSLKVLQAQLAAQRSELELKKTDLQKQSASLVAQVLEQQAQKKELNAQLNKISAAQTEIYTIINGLKKKTAQAQKIIAQNERDYAEFERQMDALLATKIQDNQIDQQVSNNGKMIWPFPYRNCYITSNFGEVSSVRSGPHQGLDISIADKSQEYVIQAALDGVILAHGFNRTMGNYVIIYHGYYAPTGKTIKTTYMHMKYFPEVEDNAEVKAGKVIGIMGTTGNSTGPHLHFQINEYTSSSSSVPVNPLSYVSNPYR
jgi:murein DD-endopeptidase MepM/ murein hydrolase activator NlpD